jgi:exosortase
MAPMKAPRYLRLWLIAALACVIALVYWPSTVFLIHEKWSDTTSGTYSHGWLIAVICAALLVRSRREIVAAPARASRPALLALAGAVLAWLVCYRSSIGGLAAPLVPLIFWLAATAAFGWAVGRLLLFPVAYFYFAEPIWYGTPLKDLTVLAMRGALALTGPTALITDDVIHLPNGAFSIEEGCSGVHYMIVGLAVAALYGEQRRDPWPVRARQLALMAALAVVANWVRVYTVIEAGYLTNMQSYLVRVSHVGFGWCVFAVALLVFFWVAPLFEPEAAAPASATPPPALRPVLRPELPGFLAVVAVLLALPALSAGAKHFAPAPARPAAPVDPRGDWHAVPVNVRSAWMPVFVGADVMSRESFANAHGETVEALTVLYRSQRQRAQLGSATNSLFGEALQPLAQLRLDSAVGPFEETEVADASGVRSLIWWRYEVAGRTLVGPWQARLWYGINATVWNPTAGLLALRAACGADCNSARRTLRSFITGSDLR